MYVPVVVVWSQLKIAENVLFELIVIILPFSQVIVSMLSSVLDTKDHFPTILGVLGVVFELSFEQESVNTISEK